MKIEVGSIVKWSRHGTIVYGKVIAERTAPGGYLRWRIEEFGSLVRANKYERNITLVA